MNKMNPANPEILSILSKTYLNNHAARAFAITSASNTSVCSSTMPQRFSSPQRVNAPQVRQHFRMRGILAIKTSSAAHLISGSSPARQINSVNLLQIFASLESSSNVVTGISEKFASTILSPASIRRTSSVSNGSFISRA
jgi:hypothetical protein